MQAELYLSRRGTYASDLAEAAVGDAIVRVSVTGNIENVEKVCAETHHLLPPNVEVLE